MMFSRNLFRGLAGAAAVLVGGSFVSGATTVYFNDANRGPSGSLDIGGVTVTTSCTVWTNGIGYSPLATQAATTSGAGCGAAGMGPSDSFNLIFHYSPDDSGYDWMSTESASLTLDDPSLMITSVTIAPHVTATIGSLDPVPVQLPFTAFVLPVSGGGPGSHQISSSDPATYSVSFYNGPGFPSFITSQISLSSALNGFGDGFPANQYRQQNISDDVTLDYGFSIVSVEYAAVPEPGVASLLGMGVAGYACVSRRLKQRK